MGKQVKRISQIRKVSPRKVLVFCDPGIGKKGYYWLILHQDRIQVKKHGSWKSGYSVSKDEVAAMVCHRAQVHEANRILAMPEKVEGDAGPLFKGG